MNCPACNNLLSQVEVGGIELDICKNGCGGIWFDQLEFKKFDEPHEEAGTELLDIPIDKSIIVDYEKKRNCPKCSNIPLVRHFFSVKKEVEIDTCYTCGGVWLDAGELNNIRSNFMSEEEKKEAASVVFEEMFGEEMEKLKIEQEQNTKNARRVANMFKYVMPSYYISGKKGWGAF